MSLISLLPSLVGAVQILKDREVRKDNDSHTSTKLAIGGLGASGVLALDPEQPPEVVIATVLVSVGLYLYRRRGLVA